MMIGIWARGLLASHQGRLFGGMLGLGLTVSLLIAIGAFTLSASRTMTARAIEGVPVDWQVQLLPGADPAATAATLRHAISVREVATVGYASVAGFEARTGDSVQTTGPGQALGLAPGYRHLFPRQITLLAGNWDGPLLAEQTAANLHATVGTTVAVRRPGLPPATLTVSGIVALPNADALFGAIGVRRSAQPPAPPDNVVLMPLADWRALFDPQQAVRPDSVRLQLHVRLAHRPLPTAPGAAYTALTRLANHFEALAAGSAVVGNRLAERLAAVRADALYARVLFLFLGAPGVVLAALVTLAVTASGAERHRHEAALLRVRGASVRTITLLASVEAALIAVGGLLAGLLLAAAVASGFWRLVLAGGVLAWALAAAVAAAALAAVGVLLPGWQAAREQAIAGLRDTPPERAPLWQRLGADVALLVLAGVIFAAMAGTGYQIVVAPEGVPQTAVHYQAFLAPLAFWLGAGLLTLRATRLLLGRAPKLLRRLISPVAGDLAPLAAAALSRQSGRLARAAALVALAFAFAVSTSVFDTTYEAQSVVDARLTNGADVAVTGTAATPAGPMLPALSRLPGVRAAAGMLHRYAYVGSDLQDLYGIDPKTLAEASPQSGAFYVGMTAAQAFSRLARHENGVLVSEETVQTFQLQPGDTLNLRLQAAADHRYHAVPFRYLGMVREFPTAPRDSFLVANAGYVKRMIGGDATEVVLLRASGATASVAAAARRLLAGHPGLAVTSLGEVRRIIGSSLTAIDLGGLTRLELAFAVLMVVAVTGLVFLLGLAERRRSFLLLATLGAKPRQLGAFLWTEAAVMLGVGLPAGVLIGLVVAEMLVKLLSGVFDPPPEWLALPWAYLAGVLAVGAGAAAAAVLLAGRLARNPDPAALRQD